jgi:hypothetical protein
MFFFSVSICRELFSELVNEEDEGAWSAPKRRWVSRPLVVDEE